MVLAHAGGCSVRLDLLTIFTRSIAGGNEGDLSLEEGGVGADVNPDAEDHSINVKRASGAKQHGE
jgi:hypothetical protein